MKRIAAMFAAGTFALMVGCSDGIEFNGEAQVQQFPIRTTPIIHFPLPTEHPTTGELDYTLFAPIDTTVFQELASPGHDLWAIALEGGSIFHCSDNPTCNTPGPVPDWSYLMVGYVGVGPISQTVVWPPQGNWPHPQIQGGAAHQQVGGWVLSFANQWFLRELDGAERPPQVLGKAPI